MLQIGKCVKKRQSKELPDNAEDSLDSSKVKLKRSRKGSVKVTWTEDLENDLIDIICSNEHHKRKLIFTNSRTASNAEVYEKVMKEMFLSLDIKCCC